MNKYATIIPAISFKKVTFYTIKFEDADPMFLQFVNDHASEEFEDDLNIIRTWITKIGKNIGAREQYFRFESFRGGDTSALPPPARYIETDCNLRLYCMRINNGIVILFNGGKKETAKAQDCENVRHHFLLANQLSKAIYNAIIEKDILINEENRQLIFDESFELVL